MEVLGAVDKDLFEAEAEGETVVVKSS